MAAVALLGSTAASAITYTGSFTATATNGAASLVVDYSIGTDGTLGTLGLANFTDFTLSENVDGTIYTGSGGINTVAGTGATATATALSFDFSQNGGLLVFVANPGAAICFSGLNAGCLGAPAPSAFLIDFSHAVVGYTLRSTGVEVLATAAPTVPEPAAWALMVAGFGLVGTAVRRKALAAA